MTVPRSLFVLAAAALASCDPPEPAVRRPEVNPAPDTARAAPRPTPAPAAAADPHGEDWNGSQVAWQSYASAIARARTEHKPVCVVFYADWCPHCRNYSHVFADPQIAALAHDFEMVRVNVDEEPDVAARYVVDGTYVPRTYFVAPDGTTLADIDAARPQYRYFFNEHDPRPLLTAMTAALARR